MKLAERGDVERFRQRADATLSSAGAWEKGNFRGVLINADAATGEVFVCAQSGTDISRRHPTQNYSALRWRWPHLGRTIASRTTIVSPGKVEANGVLSGRSDSDRAACDANLSNRKFPCGKGGAMSAAAGKSFEAGIRRRCYSARREGDHRRRDRR